AISVVWSGAGRDRRGCRRGGGHQAARTVAMRWMRSTAVRCGHLGARDVQRAGWPKFRYTGIAWVAVRRIDLLRRLPGRQAPHAHAAQARGGCRGLAALLIKETRGALSA